jgi:hypothetical protein
VEAQEKEIKLCDLALVQSKDRIAALEKETRSLRESNEAWYKNPFVMAALGLAVGAVGAAVLIK